MDWLYFAILVVVIGIVGIAIGLFVAGRLSGWGERRTAEDDGTYMTPIGPAEGTSDGDAGPASPASQQPVDVGAGGVAEDDATGGDERD